MKAETLQIEQEVGRLARFLAQGVVRDADAELGANTIGIWIKGTLVDECGAFGADFKDVDFSGWTRVALESVAEGRIRYQPVDELGLDDAAWEDVLACVLVSFLDLHIAWLLGQVGAAPCSPSGVRVSSPSASGD